MICQVLKQKVMMPCDKVISRCRPETHDVSPMHLSHLEIGLQPASALRRLHDGGELVLCTWVVQCRVRQVVRHTLEAL